MQAQDDKRNAMLDLVRRWRESGATAKAFAQEQGVTPWTLYYWQQGLPSEARPTRRRRRARRVTLAPVHVVASAAAGGEDLEVILAGGDRVRVPPGVSAEMLRRVVQVLRTAC